MPAHCIHGQRESGIRFAVNSFCSLHAVHDLTPPIRQKNKMSHFLFAKVVEVCKILFQREIISDFKLAYHYPRKLVPATASNIYPLHEDCTLTPVLDSVSSEYHSNSRCAKQSHRNPFIILQEANFVHTCRLHSSLFSIINMKKKNQKIHLVKGVKISTI